MNGIGKPFLFLTRSVPGSPPLLWVGNDKHELDRETAIHWGHQLDEYRAELLKELMQKEKRNG